MNQPLKHPSNITAYQLNVVNWIIHTFGTAVALDTAERCHRFLEEALELVQSLGCTASEAHQLVDYVFGRAVGEPGPEFGATMLCLAGLAHAAHLDLETEAGQELARCWNNSDKIRAKWLTKPKHSPLPQPVDVLLPDAVAQWFLDNHQDIDLKHLDALTDLVRRARNDGADIYDQLFVKDRKDRDAGPWNALFAAKERAEEEARLMRAVVEAGDDLYASMQGQASTKFQTEALSTYAKVSNAFRAPRADHPGRPQEKVPHQVRHIVINEAAHGQE